jgi:DNA polymerase
LTPNRAPTYTMLGMGDGDELREELAGVAASLRAYLEQQVASGATGIPRGEVPRPSATSEAREAPRAVASVPAPVPVPAPAKPPEVAAPPARPPPAAAATSTKSTDPTVRLPQLEREISGCTKCALATTRTRTVFARGNPSSAICFIGEAPGADEDAQGIPFVGRAGQLLDRMIEAMGLSPERDVYVTNILRCRPPGNRRPEPDEIAACLPYLSEQLDLARPKVIVALGNTAVSTLLGTKLGISKVRGQWKLYRGGILVMPTYHPSYLLRPSAQQAEAKKQAWEDLQAVLRELKLPIPPPKKRALPRDEEEPS